MAEIYSLNPDTGEAYIRALPGEDLSGWTIWTYDHSGNGSTPVGSVALDTSLAYAADPDDGYVYYLQQLGPLNTPSGQRDAIVLVDDSGNAVDTLGWGKDSSFDLGTGPGDGTTIDPSNDNYAPGDGPWYTNGPPWDTAPNPTDPGGLIPLPPPCFAAGTLIETPGGRSRVEEIVPGQLVLTLNGPQVVQWCGCATVQFGDAHSEKFRPIVFRAGCFARDQPFQDLWLSPQHRVLRRSARNELFFGVSDVFVPAKFLVNGVSVQVDRSVDRVDYVHILLENHEVLCSNGLHSESLYLGNQILSVHARSASDEFRAIFSSNKLKTPNERMELAYPVLRRHEAALTA